MAQHKDIGRAHAKSFGEGWHMEYHPKSIRYHTR